MKKSFVIVGLLLTFILGSSISSADICASAQDMDLEKINRALKGIAVRSEDLMT